MEYSIDNNEIRIEKVWDWYIWKYRPVNTKLWYTTWKKYKDLDSAITMTYAQYSINK